ncbi:MAG: MATE family efflux transporter [Calditrichia bacterium]
MKLFHKIWQRWQEENGYREVLVVALPMILSTGAWSLQQFIDRIFLTWHSAEAVAAALPASLVSWTITSLFVGTAAYVNTFVAQYYGAEQHQRIGASVWQGIYLSLLVVLIAAILYPLSPYFFNWSGHSAEVLKNEIVYFRILLFGAPAAVVSNAITGFYAGRGKTVTVMWVNVAATLVNIVLDYILIFGKLGFPQMGIAGAAIATVIASWISALLFFILIIQKRYEHKYATRSNWRLDTALFKRLIRFGLPSGLQFTLELIAFTLFILFVGRLGTKELAATNIAFNINTLAFLPMYGLTIAISSLVGQRLGKSEGAGAERVTWSAFHIAFFYFGTLAYGYFFIPELFLFPYELYANPAEFLPIKELARMLLIFVAVYSLFDAMNMVFSGALKGAGDTRFVAIASISLSWFTMVIPSFIGLNWLNVGIYTLWSFVTLYVISLGIVFYFRFRAGKWKNLRVIESGASEAK